MFVFQYVHVAWFHALVCCVETGSVQTQFPLYSKRNVPAATAIKVVNNPSHQFRQGPLSPPKNPHKGIVREHSQVFAAQTWMSLPEPDTHLGSN